jgi:hypothetical protein
MSRIAVPLAIAFLAAALPAGCGSSSDGGSGTQTGSQTGEAAGAQTQGGAPGATAPAGASAQSCGNTTVTGTSGLRVTGVGCAVGRGVVAAWSANDACAAGNSRPACTVSGYRCIGARTEAGIAVSCARPGRSIAFLARRRS